MNKERCNKILAGGKQCRAYALKDSECCIFHDERPEIVQIREEAARLAGLSQKVAFPEVLQSKLPALTKPITIRKARDVRKAIVRTLQEIRFGQLELEVGRTMLYGYNVYINCIDKIDLLERIEKLEIMVKCMRASLWI